MLYYYVILSLEHIFTWKLKSHPLGDKAAIHTRMTDTLVYELREKSQM